MAENRPAEKMVEIDVLPFFPLSASGISEALCEGVVIDLELRDFFVLIRGDGDELGLFVDVSSEGGDWDACNVVASDNVKSGLVLVHRVQYRLENVTLSCVDLSGSNLAVQPSKHSYELISKRPDEFELIWMWV